MNFGIVLPTFLYNADREALAKQSYASLIATEFPEGDAPVIFAVVVGQHSADVLMSNLLQYPIGIAKLQQPDDVHGPDQAVAWIVEKFFEMTDCTHVIELADDLVYHPEWFSELKALVERHPDATAWSVYRSAHVNHHRTLQRDANGDHLVTSMAGNGTCWTREEWKAWGVDWRTGSSWPVPTGGNTLDLHHAYARPGNRWATDKSYMQHIGVNVGLHAGPGVPEFALNFAEV